MFLGYGEMTNFYNMPDEYDSPKLAWQAGFIYGVTSAVNEGQRVELLEFASKAHDELTLWQNLGRDYANGIWTMLGARMGVYMTLITPTWDFRQIDDDTALDELFATIENSDPELVAGRIAEDLVNELNLPIVMLGVNESAFLRYYLGLAFKSKDAPIL
jgi:hypothetical protein